MTPRPPHRQRPEIIVTLNGARMKDGQIASFIEAGGTTFRLNGTFIRPDTVGGVVRLVRRIAAERARLLLDLPGYKLRFLYLPRPIRFRAGVPFRIEAAHLNYPGVLRLLTPGRLMRIKDGTTVLTIVETAARHFVCAADRSGVIEAGKGLHLDGISYSPSPGALPMIDRQLLTLARKHGFDAVGLSFANTARDVTHVKRRLLGSATTVIPKIESKDSVRNLASILRVTREVIIDRGDLAGEVGLAHVWGVLRRVVASCKQEGCRVYVATHIVPSMTRNPIPSIAEVDSLASLIDAGIDGVQLSDETAVGRYPLEAIRLVSQMFAERPAVRRHPSRPPGVARFGFHA